jgi:hypothetical protein
MRWFNKNQQHFIPRELYLFENSPGKVSKTCITCEDKEVLLEKNSVLTKKQKIIKFEIIKQYCMYGFTFQAEKTLKDLISDYPLDPDVWFELYLFYSSMEARDHLAKEALIMSVKLHFKGFAFEYQNHQSFLVNLSRFLYSLMLRKHNLENVTHKTNNEKIQKNEHKRERYLVTKVSAKLSGIKCQMNRIVRI